MKTLKNILCCFLLLFLLNSCVVNKPDATKVSYPDYNNRRVVTDAHYHKKLSYTGITLTIGGVAIGAAVGYNTRLVTIQNGENRSLIRPANAFIGAMVGYSIGSLINYSFGLNKTLTSEDPSKWLIKANKKLILIPNSVKYNNFTTIVPSTEFSFTIKNIQDARDFASTFPKSTKNDDIMKSAIENCTRDNMPELISLFPDSKYVLEAKTAYIQRSNTYEDLSSAVYKYPEVKIDVESKFAGFVRNISNASDFIKRYPTSNYKRTVVTNAFNTADQTTTEISKLKMLYPNDFYLTTADISDKPSIIQKNYLSALSKLESFPNQLSVLEFYKKYQYINYSSRDWDILENVWNVNYYKFEDGNLLIGQILSLPDDIDYKSLNISINTANKFINEKLEKEMVNVSISENYLLDSQNKQWEEWKEFKMFDAPWVDQTGEIKYLTYGVIINKSKFDLPVKASFSLPLYKHSVSKILGYTYSETTDYLGSGYVDFYYPKILSGESFPYCALFDFGSGTSATGFKFLIVRSYSEIQTGQVKYTLLYNQDNVSKTQIDKQIEWLNFLKDGFSKNISVTDYLGILSGKGEYSKDYQLQRWDDFKRDLKQTLIQSYVDTYGNGNTSNSNNSNPSVTSNDCIKLIKEIKDFNFCGVKIDVAYKFECVSSGYSHTIFWWPGGKGAEGNYGCLYEKDGGWRIDDIKYDNHIDVNNNSDWKTAAKKVCNCD